MGHFPRDQQGRRTRSVALRRATPCCSTVAMRLRTSKRELHRPRSAPGRYGDALHATQHVCAAVAIELWDVVAPHGLVRPGALSDTAIAVVLVSTIPLRMTCATLHRHLWPCRNNQRAAQQPHCPQRSPRLLRAFHELSEPAVHVAMLVALFERMLRCCINILILSYVRCPIGVDSYGCGSCTAPTVATASPHRHPTCIMCLYHALPTGLLQTDGIRAIPREIER